MNKKTKGHLSILVMSVFFYMMIDTKYTRALGDYILEFFGMKSWSGDYTGTHLTVIYFGILFVLAFFNMRKFAIEDLKYSGKKVFIIFVILMILFSSTTTMVAKTIKMTSEGLLSIGYNSENSSMKYKYKNNEYTEFEARLELQNYSKEDKEFYISIDRSYYSEDEIKIINFYTYEGTPEKFYLPSGESKKFLLNLEDYKIDGESKGANGGGSGSGFEILLRNDNGEIVRLNSKNFFGIEVKK